MTKILRAHAKVILYKSKTLANGTHPVMLRITFKQKRKFYSTGYSMGIDEFDKIYVQQRTGRLKAAILTQLQAVEIRAKKMIERIIEDKNTFSHRLFEDNFFSKISETDIFKLFEDRIAYHEKRGKYKTRDICESSLNSFKTFWDKEVLDIDDLTPEFLQKYEAKHEDLSPNTLGVYERNLRTIYNIAIQKGLVSPDQNPFAHHKIPKRPGVKKALSKDDILSVLNHRTKKYTHKWLAQQVYIFSYLCNGMNLKDIANLRWTDIADGRILFIRSKTSSTSHEPKIHSIKVTKEIQFIFDDLTHFKEGENSYVFPILRKGGSEEDHYKRVRDYDGVLNRNIRKIGAELEIKKDFTFYSARHSWATVLKRAGVSVSIISELMDHSSEAVTRVYLDSFGDDELDKLNKLLI